MMDNRTAATLYRKVTGHECDWESWGMRAARGDSLPLPMLLDRIVGAPSDAAAAKIMRRDGWGEVRGHNSRWMRTIRGQAHRIRRIWQQMQKEQKR